MSGRIVSAAAFLAAAVLKEEDVPLGNGQFVRIREMNVVQRAEFSERSKTNAKTVSPWLVATVVIDENGNPFLSPDDVALMQQASPELLEKIGLASMRQSGLLKKEDDKGND